MASPIDRERLATAIAPAADELTLDREFKYLARKSRVLITVFKFGRCLIDLNHKQEIG